MRELVFFKDGKICLDTTQNVDAFAKSRYAQRLSEEGTKASYENGAWNFSPWRFTSSLQFPELRGDCVCLTGEGKPGKSLHEILFYDDESLVLEESAAAKKHFVLSRTISLLEEAVTRGVKIIPNGTGGIFVSNEADQIIFLPRTIFENSVDCLSPEESTELDGIDTNPFIQGMPAMRFLQAELIYTVLTGSHPYAEKNPAAHKEDLLDLNFIPLKNTIWALDDALSSWCDAALSQTAAKPVEIPPLPKESLLRELGLTQDGTLAAGNGLLPVIRKSDVSQEAFSARVKSENERARKKLLAKRWLRKYKTTLIAIAAAIAVVSSVALIYRSSQMRKRTSKSLTSLQTIEMFYSALNLLDVDSIQNSSSGRESSSVVNIVSNAYVSAKTRSLVTMDNVTITPAYWLTENNEGRFNMFGLTQFTVDGIKHDIFRQGPVKNTHPKKLTVQDGDPLSNGMKETHVANYYLVYTDGEGVLHVLTYEDRLTLTYQKDKWLVTSVLQSQDEKEMPYSVFYSDYTLAMEAAEKNVPRAADLLRSKYYWLSTTSEIFDAQNWNSSGLR